VKIYLDDEREAPEGWVRVTTVKACIDLLIYHSIGEDPVTELSLDHDLGDDRVGTGYDVLTWIEAVISPYSSLLRDYAPPKIHIHTANASARVKMELAVEAIERRMRERTT
jgi:hypothetical protein